MRIGLGKRVMTVIKSLKHLLQIRLCSLNKLKKNRRHSCQANVLPVTVAAQTPHFTERELNARTDGFPRFHEWTQRKMCDK